MLIGNRDEPRVKLSGNLLIHPKGNDLRDNLREFCRRVLINALTSTIRQINLT